MSDENVGGGCGSAIDDSVRRVHDSGDIGALRSALLNEATERRRAECLANIQTEITKYTLDLLAREPDLDGFFRALLKTLAEEAESQVAGVWLLNEDKQCCDFWMAHFGGQVVTTKNLSEFGAEHKAGAQAQHLFVGFYIPGLEPGIYKVLRHPEKLSSLRRESENMRALRRLVEARRDLVQDRVRVTNRFQSMGTDVVFRTRYGENRTASASRSAPRASSIPSFGATST